MNPKALLKFPSNIFNWEFMSRVKQWIGRMIAVVLLISGGESTAQWVEAFDKDPAGWERLEGPKKTGEAKWTVDNGIATVGGAVRRPVEPIAIPAGSCLVSFRFLMPEKVEKWASVAAVLYGATSEQRLYAAVLLGAPDTPAGQVSIFVEEPSANAKRHGTAQRDLKAGAWYILEVEITGGDLKMRIRPDGESPSERWDAKVKMEGMLARIEGVGIRTYANEISVDDFHSSAIPANASAPRPAPPTQPGAAAKAQRAITSALDRSLVPEPIFDADPELVELYWRAWEIAHAHVKDSPGAPHTPYMDEAFWDDTVWIWDTSFMSLFCRYSPEQFPGVESLLNFYAVMHDGATSPMTIQHPDNPPLFAWVEYDNARFTADTTRLKWLLNDTKYLQRHYDWFNKARRGMSVKGAKKGVDLMPHEKGFFWSGVASGMDNSPRFIDRDALRVDAIAQQELSALYIARMAKRIGNNDLETKFQAEYDRIKALINRYYWDEKDGIYYDIKPGDGSFVRVKTPAAFWPMLAEMCSPEQAKRLAEHARDPQVFGGPVPWPSVARSDPNFDGNYWRGAVWLPLAYMATKALEKYDFHALADEHALALVRDMNRTYRDVTPNTIWECYDPNKPGPGMHDGKRSRPEFCGWSALGPTSMLIENVLGFHDIDAASATITWRLHHTGRHGVRRLRCGDVVADLIHDAGVVTIDTKKPFTLIINGNRHLIAAGQSRIEALATSP